MRRPTLFAWVFAISLTLPTPGPHAQSRANGPTFSGWRVVAPHIQVGFAQLGPGSCTWRFRNADDARTLESMRFEYTYATVGLGPPRPGGTSPPGLGASTTRTGEDVLPEPLQPLEVEGGPDLYHVQAMCSSLDIRVTQARCM